MPSRFKAGSIAYAKDGKSYVVEVVDGGTIYCTADNGVETDFPDAALLTESEWAQRADGRRDVSYTRIKQARAYGAAGEPLDRAAAEQLLVKAERLRPSLLDFIAFLVAQRILVENKDEDLLPGLSIVKCRAVFDEAKPEVRARLLANILGIPPATLISAVRLGDNLMRAMLDKGLLAHEAAFEEFLDRPRR